MEKPNSRISVLSKVVTDNGSFDEDACQHLLGDYYDNFIKFCNHLKIMTDEIDSVGLVELRQSDHKAMFEIRKKDGQYINIET